MITGGLDLKVVVRLPLVKGESVGDKEVEDGVRGEGGKGYSKSDGIALMPDRRRTGRLSNC